MNKILPLVCKDCFWVWGRRDLADIFNHDVVRCPMCHAGTIDLSFIRYSTEEHIIRHLKMQTDWDDSSKLPEAEKGNILKKNAEMVTLEFEL